jgi:hypothetical protein
MAEGLMKFYNSKKYKNNICSFTQNYLVSCFVFWAKDNNEQFQKETGFIEKYRTLLE